MSSRAPVLSAAPRRIKFAVDSALLRELGQRLVGNQYVALAELVKNAYDADATEVELLFESDQISVVDNGHGMTEHEFETLWMRVGSPHKARLEYSPRYRRPLTGSKGVGRLAAQFLAQEVQVLTRGHGGDMERLAPDAALCVADLDWEKAVSEGNLTEVEAELRTGASADERAREVAALAPQGFGTTVVMRKLRQEWDSQQITRLAREIWALRPPVDLPEGDPGRFDVSITADAHELERDFEKQMAAILEIWTGRVTGTYRRTTNENGALVGELDVRVYLSDGERVRHVFTVPDPAIEDWAEASPQIDQLEYDIRIFDLSRRQPRGIRVEDARKYLRRFGGVNIFDAGFRLPHHGAGAEGNEWLGLDQDHATRRERSSLLPEDLRVNAGLTHLPVSSRVYGTVDINTSEEQRRVPDSLAPPEPLTIQVTRDRLVTNAGFEQLRKLVRIGIDYYAQQAATRQFSLRERRMVDLTGPNRWEPVSKTLEEFEPLLPERALVALTRQVALAEDRGRDEERRAAQRIALLGGLASAGMVAVSLEHELHRQLGQVRAIAENVPGPDGERIRELLDVTVQTRNLLGGLASDSGRQDTRRFRLLPLLTQTFDQLGPIVRRLDLDVDDVQPDIRLPVGSYSAWSAIFHNLIVNAVNATMSIDTPKMRASTETHGARRALSLEDNGIGVDVSDSERLFQPFERALALDPSKAALGFGGSGLGLMIVRTVAESVNCTVRFAQPSTGWSTRVLLEWERSDES